MHRAKRKIATTFWMIIFKAKEGSEEGLLILKLLLKRKRFTEEEILFEGFFFYLVGLKGNKMETVRDAKKNNFISSMCTLFSWPTPIM